MSEGQKEGATRLESQVGDRQVLRWAEHQQAKDRVPASGLGGLGVLRGLTSLEEPMGKRRWRDPMSCVPHGTVTGPRSSGRARVLPGSPGSAPPTPCWGPHHPPGWWH